MHADDSARSLRRIFVGMSGASGAIIGIRLLQVLRELPDIETHLVVSPAAGETIALETDWSLHDVKALADVSYRFGDVSAALSSGSFPMDAGVVIPCSVRTAAAIAWGVDDNLLVRAADVTLKERRPLVVGFRETPLHLGHIRTLAQLAEIGAIVFPLMPAFYMRPENLDEVVDHLVARVLDVIKVPAPSGLIRRWQGPPPRPADRDPN